MNNQLKSTLAAISGAGIGALTTYFFEPQKGESRRNACRKSIGRTAETGQKGLASGFKSLRQSSSDLGHSAAEGISRFGQAIAERAGEYSSGTSRRLGKYVGRSAYEHSTFSSGLVQALAAAGLVATGAGLMYVFDPEAGRRRREQARDTIRSSVQQVSQRLSPSRNPREGTPLAAGMIAPERRTLHEPISTVPPTPPV